jgi:hypothetical protein
MLAAGVAWAGTIVGTPKGDVLRGSPLNDKLYGKAGNDRLYGYGGNDLLVGGPGTDLLACGPGRDVAIADSKDKVGTDCEATSLRMEAASRGWRTSRGRAPPRPIFGRVRCQEPSA